MYKKIQNYGLPKNRFEEQLRFIAIEAAGYNEIKANVFNEVLDAFKEVLLYGWDNVTNNNYKRSTIEIIKSLSLKKIDEISFQRNLDQKTKIEQNLAQLDKLHNYIRQFRADTSETEKEFEVLLNSFMLFLSNYYSENYLPLIKDIEDQVKDKIQEIQASNIDNKNQELFDYLDDLEKESINKFEALSNDLEKGTLELAEEGVDIVEGTSLSNTALKANTTFWAAEYMSNVKGNLGTFFRQTKESFSQDFRSFEDKINKISINKNNMKLSVVSEYKALFRNILAESKPSSYYKAVIAPNLITDLDVNGKTQQILYTIKTPDEWDIFAKTTNVVNGFGIHHNSNEFYLPIDENMLETEQQTAKEQRKELKELLN